MRASGWLVSSTPEAARPASNPPRQVSRCRVAGLSPAGRNLARAFAGRSGGRRVVLDPNHPEEAVEPTAKQLAFLRALAQRTGETFAYPRTRAQASSEIRRLRQRKPSSRVERFLDRRDVSRDIHTGAGDATLFTDDEVQGYGSSARWAGSEGAER